MVWVHGGSFNSGATRQPDYDGASLAANSGVVVVTIAYRLGPFGFFRHETLKNENDDDDGNWGLQDQRAALQWVQSNIEAFGGDPKRVLLFGGSAGAASVCLHLISPRSCGLFAAAGMQSGFCDAAPPNVALGCGDALTKAVNCSGGNDTAKCLRSLDVRGESPFWYTVAQSYRLASPTLQAADDGTSGFNITMSGCFVPSYGGGGGDFGIGSKNPEEKIWTDPGRVCKVPVIMGTTTDEGTVFMPSLLVNAEKASADFEGAIIQGLLRGAGGIDNSTLESALMASYGVSPATLSASASASTAAAAALVEPKTQFAATSAALGDWLFTCPTQRAARALSFAFASMSSSGDTARITNETTAGVATDTAVTLNRPGVFVYTFDVIRRCNFAPAEYVTLYALNPNPRNTVSLKPLSRHLSPEPPTLRF